MLSIILFIYICWICYSIIFKLVIDVKVIDSVQDSYEEQEFLND